MKMISNIIKYFYFALFFITPLIFSSLNSELFELPKMYFVYAVTAIVLSLHLFNWIKNKTPLYKKSFLDIPLILFLVSQIISTVISVDPHTSIFGYYSRLNGGLLSTISYLILYWVLKVYIDKKLISTIVHFSLLSGFMVALYAIAQHFGIDKRLWIQDVQSRVFSTFGQPNWLAAYLCILLPFSLTKTLDYFSQKNYLHFTIYNLLSTIFFVGLLFTKSKSGIIAAIISIGIYFALTLIKNIKSKQTLFFSFLSLIIFFTLSLFINNPIKNKVFPQKLIIETSKTENLNITPSEDIRKIVWKGAINLWKQFPLFGTGVETFAYSYYWVRPIEHNLTSEWDFLYNKAHNEYINFLTTTGTIGLITYLILLFSILFILVKNLFNKYSNSSDNQLTITALSAIISILITNFAGFSVVITSLYLFLLPALFNNAPSSNIQTSPFKRKNIFTALSFTVCVLFFLMFSKILFYYLADISYSQSKSFDDQQQYTNALKSINQSIGYRPDEPIYLNHVSTIYSKLALLAHAQQKKDLTNQYIDKAISYSNLAVNISPSNTNLWKERAQMFYYLSSIETQYFQNSIESLIKVTLLAPTDAKTYYLIGQFLKTANLTDDALNYYQKAVELKSNYDHAYFELGQIYFDKKNYSDAKIHFESTTKYAPNNSDAKTYLDQISTLSQ